MGHVLAFAAVAVVMIVTPGPDTALIVRNTLFGGRGHGGRTSLGVLPRIALLHSAAAAGAAAIVVALPPPLLAAPGGGRRHTRGWPPPPQPRQGKYRAAMTSSRWRSQTPRSNASRTA